MICLSSQPSVLSTGASFLTRQWIGVALHQIASGHPCRAEKQQLSALSSILARLLDSDGEAFSYSRAVVNRRNRTCPAAAISLCLNAAKTHHLAVARCARRSCGYSGKNKISDSPRRHRCDFGLWVPTGCVSHAKIDHNCVTIPALQSPLLSRGWLFG